jgi:hypothetical protein
MGQDPRSLVVAVIALCVSALSLALSFYQWKRQRGAVKVSLFEMQAYIVVDVRVDSAAPAAVQQIVYQVAMGPWWSFLRFFSEMRHWGGGASPFAHRFRVMWMNRGFISMGRLKPADSTLSDEELYEMARDTFHPLIVGPSLPLEIPGFSAAGWRFDLRHHAELFAVTARFENKRPRIRFLLGVSGVPQRVARSGWMRVDKMDSLTADNAWLFEGAPGWDDQTLANKRMEPTP